MAIEYSNPFTSFTKGLREQLLVREARRRQEALDELARDREARLKEHDAAQLEVSRAQAASLEEARKSAADARAATTAAAVAKTLTPGTVMAKDGSAAKALAAGHMDALIPDQMSLPAKTMSMTTALPGVGEGAEPMPTDAPMVGSQALPSEATGNVTYAGTPEQNLAVQERAVWQKLADDPNTSPEVKLWAKGRLGGATVPTELIKDDPNPGVYWTSPDKRLMLKRNPESNKFEQFTGEIPKGSTILQAPQPPSNVTISQFTPDAVRAYQTLLQAGSINPTITRANAPLMNEVLTNITKEGDDAITDLTGARAGFQADAASLTQTTKQLDAITAYENLARRNIEVLKTTLPKLVDTGMPVLNAPIRQVLQMTGSPEVAKFQTAIRPVQAEVARILNGSSNLTGVVSVHAQQEVEELLRGDYNTEQFMAALGILEADMKNRAAELKKQQTEIQGRLRRAPTPAVVTPGKTQPTASPSGGAGDPLGIL